MRRILDQAVVVVVEVVVAEAIAVVVVAVAEVILNSSCHIVEDIGPRLIPSRGSVTREKAAKR